MLSWTCTGRHSFGNENCRDAGKTSSLLPEDGVRSLGGDDIMLAVPGLDEGRIPALVFLG